MTSIKGLRELASDEALYTVDVNQWIAAIIVALKKTPNLSDNAKFGTRIQEYALTGRRMVNGKKLVIGTSRRIMDTFVHTLANSTDPDGFCLEDPNFRVPVDFSQKWFLKRYNSLARVNAVFFDQTVWTKDELTALSAAPYGMPDWEDEGVFQTAMTLGSDAIMGLDDKFRTAVERRNMRWIGPAEMRNLLPR